MAETISHTIDRRLLGPAGIDGYLHIVEDRRDDARTAEERFADRTARVFHVRAALAKSRVQGENVRASIQPGDGASFISAPDDIRVQTRDGTYQISRNEQGELAQIFCSITATWYQEAFETFLSGVTPWLDHLCYFSNLPIFIDMLECRDELHHITITSYRTPYATVTISQGLGQLATHPFVSDLRSLSRSSQR